MAVTKSWQREVEWITEPPMPPERRTEVYWLAAASLVVTTGLVPVGLAKRQDLPEACVRLEHRELLNLNTLRTAADLLPFLPTFTDPVERALAAERVYTYLQTHPLLPNVGALGQIRLSSSELE